MRDEAKEREIAVENLRKEARDWQVKIQVIIQSEHVCSNKYLIDRSVAVSGNLLIFSWLRWLRSFTNEILATCTKGLRSFLAGCVCPHYAEAIRRHLRVCICERAREQSAMAVAAF